MKRSSSESKLVGSHVMILEVEFLQLLWLAQSLMGSAKDGAVGSG